MHDPYFTYCARQAKQYQASAENCFAKNTIATHCTINGFTFKRTPAGAIFTGKDLPADTKEPACDQ